ncbi:conserved hypothetical protein [Leishmania braziliensis MHOM/BR/75/M2904]|uniref:Uncharacterized protein n=2 Tax=Leishmania braziliensis TaxID=5660 RepID=A4HBE4_LEIBR|nr:conserved hypothetical protein [Leishmania braziliensis MHOM/BR/75/M2904]CAJ2471765.1 unnamed protein product [Leishmania braziliensis]CAM38730.2 conserved hypothetical protein [Leishmania braziliensis MHOM/BR/75/M2904]SYZ65426.1 hypothetical_protein [Leishmania braziliensis MHOM/BR/75/M2904]
MESKVIALLNSRPLLTVVEAAAQLEVSQGDLLPIFASIAASHEGVYKLLSRSVEEAASGSATAVVLRKADPLNEDTSAYALLSLACSLNVTTSSRPLQLHPSAAASLRPYPLVSRTVMETRTAATSQSLPQPAALVSPVVLPLPAAAPTEAELPKPEVSGPAVISSLAATPAALTVPPLVSEEPPQSTPASATAAPLKEEKALRAPSPMATIFDKMKEAAATKRLRMADAAAKPQRQPSKLKKVTKTENTTSLVRLARASKRKRGGASAATGAASAPSSMSFLDNEEEEDATTYFSSSEGSNSHSKNIVKEDSPIFDVVELPASNDEIIMCDYAPPLAFRPAAPLPSPPTPTPAKKASSAAVPAAAGATQHTLGSFFNTAVVMFQKSYVREVQTEMKIENGEFVCCDLPCYKHSSTGEVISEDEYHQRTAALIRSNSHSAAGSTPNEKSIGTSRESPSCPAAAQKTDSRGAVQKRGKQEQLTASPAKTLLSFFKPSLA